MVDVVMRERSRDTIEKLKNSAYVAYLMGCGNGKSFNSYCETLGLIEKKVITKEQNQFMINRAYETAEKAKHVQYKRG
jgi:hypothetical protein